jgi:hypothetical protein
MEHERGVLMASIIASGQLTLTDVNDAIVAGTAPTNPTVGTLWIDSSVNPNVLKKWNGSAWVTQTLALSSLDPNASNAITTAQTTANGKNKAYRQSTQPTGTFTVGDLWFDTAHDNRVSVWDGTQWVLNQFGNMAVANLDAGNITSGYLNSARIAANSITAQQIAIADYTNLSQIDENTNTNGNTVVTVNNKKYFKVGQSAYSELILATTKMVEFKVNDEYYIGFTGYRESGVTNVNFIIRYYYTDGSWVNAGIVSVTPGTTSGSVSGVCKITTAPDETKTINYIAFFLEKDSGITGYYYVSDIEIRKRYGGQLIVDGSITADKINANGLNINNQFIVDNNGNVTFAGNLNGASGTFNGKVEVTAVDQTTGGTNTITLDTGMITSNYFKDYGGGVTVTKQATLNNGQLLFYYNDVNYQLNGESTSSIFIDETGTLNIDASAGVGISMVGQDLYIAVTNTTFHGNVTLDANMSINSGYNNAYIFKDHGNGNVTVSAAGSDLYLGYQNTSHIQAQKELWMNAGGRVTSGSLVVSNGNVDASNGIVYGGAFKFTKTSAPPTSGDGVLWYGNGFSGLGLYIYKSTGWVLVK